jgi:hypothetical protein
MTTTVEKTEGTVSKEQIETWKNEKKVDDVHEIIIKDPKGKKVFYLSEPNDIVYAQAMSLMAEKKITKAGEALLNACYLGGCPIPERSEKTLYRTLCIQASTTIEFFETEVAKH